MSSRLPRQLGRSGRVAMSMIAAAVLILLSAALALTAGGVTAQDDDDTYVNPTYGYRIEWDPDFWEVLGDASGDLALRSDLVEIYLQSGQFYAGDATACRDDLVDRLPDDDTVLSSESYEGDVERSGEEDGRAFTTLQVELDETDDRDARTVIERIDCRTLVAGEAVLAITWLAPIDDAAQATESAETLLDALVIPSFRGQGADVTGLEAGSYVDPELGFSLAWDESDWTSFVPVDAIFGLNSTTSLISFSLPDDYDGDAAICVERSLGDLEVSPGIVEVTPIERDGEEVAGLDNAGWSYAAIDADYGGAEQFVEVRCAAIPGTGLTLRAIHSGPIEAYDAETDLAAPVFASLVIDGSDDETNEEATPEPTDDATPEADEPTEPEATPAVGAGSPTPDEPAATPEPSDDVVPPVGTDTFAPDDGGWSLSYDGDIWTPLDPAIYATVDLALAGERSTVTLDTTGTAGRDVEEILADLVEAEIVGPAGEGTDIVQLDDPPIPSDDAVGVAYRSTRPGGVAFASAIVIIPVDDESAVVVRIYASADSLAEDYDAFADLLSGVTI